MFLILLFKLLTQFPFVSFLSISILSLLDLGTEGNGQVMSFAWFVVQKGLIIRIDTTDEQDLYL